MAGSPKYLQGHFLLDSGKLAGSFWHRTVILICQHSAEGAFGLVLNRPLGHRVGEALVANLPEPMLDLPLFKGGPVQEDAMSVLHSDEYLAEANVMPNLNLSHSLDALMELGESFSSTQKIRIFLGYAGWAPGQLEDELRRQTWMVRPADLALVYHSEPDRLWQVIMREMGGIHRLFADGPDDLSWN